jgi:hypothetical protein
MDAGPPETTTITQSFQDQTLTQYVIKIVDGVCSRLYQTVSNFPSGIRAFIKMVAEDKARKMEGQIDI